jgi:hypothetical protein
MIEGMSAMHGAVRTQNIEMVDFLISIGADVNQCCHAREAGVQQDLPMFPIQIATHYGNELLVRMLIDASADANSVAGNPMKTTAKLPSLQSAKSPSLKSIVGRPSLRIALEHGEESIAELLLKCGARMPTTSTGNQNWNPLTSATQGKNYRLFRKIFQTVRAYHQITSETLALYVSVYGFSSVAELIDSGFVAPEDIHSCPEVLCAAVMQGDTTFVHKLLNDGKARLGKLPPGYGATGFALAARLGRNDMFPTFLDAGVKPYEEPMDHDMILDIPGGSLQCSGFLRCALTEAIEYLFDVRETRNEIELLELLEQSLKQLKEEFNPPDGDSSEYEIWRTSMFDMCNDAIAYERFATLKWLVSKGVDISWAPVGEEALLQYATAGANTLYIAKYLLDLGANPDPQPESILVGNAPIQNAAEHDSELLERLIRANVDVNTKPTTSHGAAALQRAAAAG